MDTWLTIVAIAFGIVLLGLLAFLLATVLRRPRAGEEQIEALLQSLAQGAAQSQADMASLKQRVEQLDIVRQSVGNVQVEVSRLLERAAPSTAVAELKAITTSLAATTSSIRSELARAKDDLTDIQAHTRARQEVEQRTADSVRRLESIIAGTQTKGVAGENVLEAVFARLPVEWQVRNYMIGGRPVEFGLRLPNNLILPIDSKWAATNLVEQCVSATEPADQERLKREVERTVLQKAKEVRKYLDPALTVAFGVAVVPDAVHDLCLSIQADLFQMNVVLVSYSMFVPYLLLVFQTVLKTGQSVDLQKLDAYIQTVQSTIDALQDELDGRLSRAITMLGNSRDDMRAHIGKLGGGLTGLQVTRPIGAPDGGQPRLSQLESDEETVGRT
jgi:DNA recombination protein RmuC